MAETSGGDQLATEGTMPERQGWGVVLDWAFRIALGLCALPSLMATIIVLGYFWHDLPGLAKGLWGAAVIPLTCAVLMLPWRILLKNRAMQVVTLITACAATHQLYASFGMFKALARSEVLFVVCGVLLAAGIASAVLYVRRTGRRIWPVAISAALLLVCFVFGAGNPQWSKYIFIWQVHYSPWRRDAANLPTNRDGIRQVLPTYTEWDARGRKTGQWSHPDGELLHTLYYPNGQKRMERLYGEDQFVTARYPNGQMEYQYDRQDRRKRAWDPNGAPREGEIREILPGSDRVEAVRQYQDGYFDGVHQYWHARDGLQDGVARRWNSQGVLIEEEYYADGYRHGPRRRFRDDGSLDWEETYDRGVLQGNRQTYPAPK